MRKILAFRKNFELLHNQVIVKNNKFILNYNHFYNISGDKPST